MLQKMGFKGGGLGARGQGIKTSIQARMRGKNEGLGLRPEVKQKLGEEDERAVAKEKESKEAAKGKTKRLNNWRVSLDERPRRAKRVFKTAQELREEAEAG